MKKNLKKLEETGDMNLFNNDLPEKSLKIDTTSDKDDNILLQEGKKIVIKKVDLEDIFNKSIKKYPNAKLAIYSVISDGTPLYVLVDNNQIVCPIGMCQYMENNKQKVKYLPILKLYYYLKIEYL